MALVNVNFLPDDPRKPGTDSLSRRTIAIGDVHGCDAALAALLDAVRPDSTDLIVQLGDCIDRGPDSRGVIERLSDLESVCRLVVLRGDHEQLLLDAYSDAQQLPRWLRNGGTETLNSYRCKPESWRSTIPNDHLNFIRATRRYYEDDERIFVHAGYESEVPMASQSDLALFWRVASADACQPHQSGKLIIVGHTAQRSGEVLDLGFLRCIDTNCFRGGWLTAMNVDSGFVWQADRNGRMRKA